MNLDKAQKLIGKDLSNTELKNLLEGLNVIVPLMNDPDDKARLEAVETIFKFRKKHSMDADFLMLAQQAINTRDAKLASVIVEAYSIIAANDKELDDEFEKLITSYPISLLVKVDDEVAKLFEQVIEDILNNSEHGLSADEFVKEFNIGSENDTQFSNHVEKIVKIPDLDNKYTKEYIEGYLNDDKNEQNIISGEDHHYSAKLNYIAKETTGGWNIFIKIKSIKLNDDFDYEKYNDRSW